MNILKCSCLSVLLMIPVIATGQSITVLGGHQKAQECFTNVGISQNMGLLSRSIVEPCTFSLNNVDLDRRDRAATYNNRGILFYMLKDYEAAFTDFANAINLLPDRSEIIVNRGNLHFLTGDYAMAIEDYNTALTMTGAPAHTIYLNIGMVHEHLKDFDRAEEFARRSLEVAPDYAKAVERLDIIAAKREALANPIRQRQPGEPVEN